MSTLCLSASSVYAGNGVDKKIAADDGYKLVWSDEFNGTALDREAWNVEVNGSGNGNDELEYYIDNPANVTLGKDPETGAGCLILTAKREKYNDGKNFKEFTSGRINTKDKVYFTHGRVESRIKLPKTANGLWPAFWLLGQAYDKEGWPRCSEIDILEMGNAEGIQRGVQDRYFNGACHWGFWKNGAYPNYAKSTTNSYSLQDGEFHTFTLEWDDDNIRMYLDREEHPDAAPYYEMGISDMNGDWATGRWFHQDCFLLFNLAVGGRFTGILNPNQITAIKEGEEAKMYVDWVRVYQKEDDENIILPDGWTSGIKEPTVEKSTTDKTVRPRQVYDVTGRKVSVPQQKGIYLVPTSQGYKKYLCSNP